MINTGDDLDKLEPIVASLLTVMAEYACDDLSKVTGNLVWAQPIMDFVLTGCMQVSAKLYGSSRELEGGDVTVRKLYSFRLIC